SAAAALAAALALATSPLALGCAEEAEPEPERALEPKPAAQPPRAQAPREDPPPGGPEYRFQRKVDWWTHALEVLFDGIDLSEEQKSEVDEILEAQLGARLRMQEFDLALSNARRRHDTEAVDAAREEFRKARAQIKEPHEIYEEMRALLDESQHPAFDMNRARHVAEMQGSAGRRPDERAEQSEYE
ncbi:MAG: hypothetical protein JRE43_07810, partial [Deltaproteobacteria bacterium]|nr:hypothetical protein [Deltaproteobacteria bacterium]